MAPARFPFPGTDYMARVGEVAYAVSYLEWMALGDLHRCRGVLPSDVTLSSLERKTTGRIGRTLISVAPRVTHGEVRCYVATCGAVLTDVSTLRNDLLHSRPATHEQLGQRLLRRGSWITDEWFDEAHEVLEQALGRMVGARPSFEDFPGE